MWNKITKDSKSCLVNIIGMHEAFLKKKSYFGVKGGGRGLDHMIQATPFSPKYEFCDPCHVDPFKILGSRLYFCKEQS